MNTLYKAYDSKLADVLEGERAVVAVISTDTIDRDREVVIPKGIDFRAFRENPVVLFAHKYDEPPIGKASWIKVEDGKLKSKTIFADTLRGEECFKLYQAGILRAFSIGFKPTTMGPPEEKEIKARPELAGCRNIVRKAELLEYSVVPVPANPEALAEAISKGMSIPEWLAPKKSLTMPIHRTRAEVERTILRIAANIDVGAMVRQAAQDAIDRMRGRA